MTAPEHRAVTDELRKCLIELATELRDSAREPAWLRARRYLLGGSSNALLVRANVALAKADNAFGPIDNRKEALAEGDEGTAARTPQSRDPQHKD